MHRMRRGATSCPSGPGRTCSFDIQLIRDRNLDSSVSAHLALERLALASANLICARKQMRIASLPRLPPASSCACCWLTRTENSPRERERERERDGAIETASFEGIACPRRSEMNVTPIGASMIDCNYSKPLASS